MNEIKKENHKNLPKFLAILLLCAVIGGVVGYFSAVFGSSDLSQQIVPSLTEFLSDATVWLLPLVSAFLILPSVLWLHKSKALFKSWDGEDEDIPDQIDQLLNRGLLCVSILAALSYFALAVAIALCKGMNTLIVTGEFSLLLIFITLFQKSTVDLTRALNPEKKGSVFDFKFEKTWLASCDENERRQIGEAAFAAFKAVNITCIVLWCLFIFTHVVFGCGLLACFAVMLIWAVLQISYIWACMKMSRRK